MSPILKEKQETCLGMRIMMSTTHLQILYKRKSDDANMAKCLKIRKLDAGLKHKNRAILSEFKNFQN